MSDLGERFTRFGVCRRHKESACPSCLAYEVHARGARIAELEAENKQLRRDWVSEHLLAAALRAAAEKARESLLECGCYAVEHPTLVALDEALGE